MSVFYYDVEFSSGLASRTTRTKKRIQVPFTRIANNPNELIEKKYLPDEIHLTSPRTMTGKDIVKFFQHIAARQAAHGIRDGFRFKSTLTRRNKGSIRRQEYFDELDSDTALQSDPAPAPSKRRRAKKKGRNGQPAQVTAFDTIEEPTLPAQETSFHATLPAQSADTTIPYEFDFNTFDHYGSATNQTLFLDTNHRFEQFIPLDESLDPAIHGFMNSGINSSFNTYLTPASSPASTPNPPALATAPALARPTASPLNPHLLTPASSPASSPALIASSPASSPALIASSPASTPALIASSLASTPALISSQPRRSSRHTKNNGVELGRKKLKEKVKRKGRR
jgi:hypothetical protein